MFYGIKNGGELDWRTENPNYTTKRISLKITLRVATMLSKKQITTLPD